MIVLAQRAPSDAFTLNSEGKIYRHFQMDNSKLYLLKNGINIFY